MQTILKAPLPFIIFVRNQKRINLSQSSLDNALVRSRCSNVPLLNTSHFLLYQLNLKTRNLSRYDHVNNSIAIPWKPSPDSEGNLISVDLASFTECTTEIVAISRYACILPTVPDRLRSQQDTGSFLEGPAMALPRWQKSLLYAQESWRWVLRNLLLKMCRLIVIAGFVLVFYFFSFVWITHVTNRTTHLNKCRNIENQIC